MTDANPATSHSHSDRDAMPKHSRRLMTIAEGAARVAAGPLLAAFRSEMAVDYKRDLHDVVTIYDKQAEACIRDYVFAHEPNSAMLGEEGGQVGEGEIQWYVDPIDGTRAYVGGQKSWGHSLAVVERGRVTAGVVVLPALERRYSAAKGTASSRPGHGARCRRTRRCSACCSREDRNGHRLCLFRYGLSGRPRDPFARSA